MSEMTRDEIVARLREIVDASTCEEDAATELRRLLRMVDKPGLAELLDVVEYYDVERYDNDDDNSLDDVFEAVLIDGRALLVVHGSGAVSFRRTEDICLDRGTILALANYVRKYTPV